MQRNDYCAMKPKHGGARKGAGRKKSGRKSYLIRMKPESMSKLQSRAKDSDRRVGEYLEDEIGACDT